MTELYRKGILKAIKELDNIATESGHPANSDYKKIVFRARDLLWEALDKAGWNFDRDYKLYRKQRR